MYSYGIDISHHQGIVDFAKVKSSGVQFVILKVSEGTSFKDSRFEEYYKKCIQYNIPVGAYIYNHVTNIEDAEKEARFAHKSLNGKYFEMGIWLDMEDKSMRKLGSTLTSIIRTEANILKPIARFVGIYCNKDWAKNVLDFKNLKKEFPFWIAGYPFGDKGQIVAANRPNECVIWQYSSKGTVPGINTKVDMNELQFDISVLLTKETNPYAEPMTTIDKNTLVNTEGIKWIQWELKESGFNVEPTGVWSTLLEDYIKFFQGICGLTVDGRVGKRTRDKLKEL